MQEEQNKIQSSILFVHQEEKQQEFNTFQIHQKKRRICLTLAVLFGLISIISGTAYVLLQAAYQSERAANEAVASAVFETQAELEIEKIKDAAQLPATKETQLNDLHLGYSHDALLAINENAVGYLQVPAVDIFLPLVQSEDNQYYTEHNISNQPSKSGSLFLDVRCRQGLNASNCVIYGHDMADGSMFGSLHKLIRPTFYQEQSHAIYIYTADAIYEYEIYSVHVAPATGSEYQASFATAAEYQQFVQEMVKRSYYEAPECVKQPAYTITLSTCTNREDERLVVQAMRVHTYTLDGILIS